MSLVAGFDLSSKKLAAVVLPLSKSLPPYQWVFEADKKLKDRPAVLHSFMQPLEEFFTELGSREEFFVFVEQPVVGRGGAHATIVQAQVQGLVFALAVQFGASGVYPVNVGTWKKEVVGHGGAKKDHVAEWVAEHHPLLSRMAGEDQDLVDASCIALYGGNVVRTAKSIEDQGLQLDP